MVSPFIRNYALGPEAPATAQLRTCLGCGHRFFRERYLPNEISRLYNDYRGKEYLEVRQAWEPWYSRKINDRNLLDETKHRRQEMLLNALKRAGLNDSIRRVVVDVGGDAGQFIPLSLSDGAYVLETSNRQPSQGVERIRDLSELPKPAGLVFCLHVLEHVPEPKKFLRDLLASPKIGLDAWIVLEVPLERPALSTNLNQLAYKRWLSWLSHHRQLLILLDAASTFARATLGRITWPLFIKQHEHVQFFHAKSFTELAKRSGVQPCLMEKTTGLNLKTHQGSLLLIGRLRQRVLPPLELDFPQVMD